MRRTLALPGLAVIALALLSGCASAPPPLLDISAHACSSSPDLIAAKSLPLGESGHPSPVKVDIDDSAPCLQTPQGKSLYAAFRLPDSLSPYLIAVRSLPLGKGIFVPHLLLLGGTGAVRRQIGQDELEFRGTTLSAIIRSHPGELYLLVAATPQSVGKTDSRIIETTRATGGATGNGGYFYINTGQDET